MTRLRASTTGHVVVVGGSGAMGRRAAERALIDGAARVTLLGRDIHRARTVAKAVGENVDARAADVTEHDQLVEAIADADFVLNNAPPYFEHRARVLDAALTVGSHYADACDDWEATVDMLERHDDARAKRLICVTGFGIAPGLDDCLAVFAMRLLDSVDELVTAWSLVEDTSDGNVADSDPTTHGVPFALVHFMQCCVGPIRLRRDWVDADVVPLEPIDVDHPLVGPVRGWTIGSPEAVTFQQSRPELRSNVNLMLAPMKVVDELRTLAAAVRAGQVGMADAAALLVPSQSDAETREVAPTSTPPVFAVACGQRDGRAASVSVDLVATVPLGVASAGRLLGSFPRLVTDGVITATGVHALTDALEPTTYLEQVARLTQPPVPTDLLIRITCTDSKERS